MNVIQVVKRFGQCGGMEEYVFQLSKELCNMGLSVKILCETQVGLSDERIEVVQLGTLKKPRWYFIFRLPEKYKVGSVAIEIRNG